MPHSIIGSSDAVIVLLLETSLKLSLEVEENVGCLSKERDAKRDVLESDMKGGTGTGIYMKWKKDEVKYPAEFLQPLAFALGPLLWHILVPE